MSRKISGKEGFQKSKSPVVEIGSDDYEALHGYFPVGYRHLYHLTATRACHPRMSYFMRESGQVSQAQLKRELEIINQHKIVDRSAYIPSSVLDHMIWAAKNESWNLQILKIVFVNLWDDVSDDMKKAYTGNAHFMSQDGSFRRIWLLAELLTGKRIDIPSLSDAISPVLLLDPSAYVVGPCFEMTNRQRVYNNLTGNANFFPTARNTVFTKQCQRAHPPAKIQQFLTPFDGKYTLAQLERATNYIRQRETTATFKIENEEDRIAEQKAWLDALKNIESLSLHTSTGYAGLLNRLQIPQQEGNQGSPWRDHEIFIGSLKQQKRFGDVEAKHILHHIGAAYEDLPMIMGGFLEFLEKIILFANTKINKFRGQVELERNWREFDIVALTGMLTIAFTLIHPLPDGNGRVHRLLVHYMLERTGYCNTLIFPISPVIMADNSKSRRKDNLLSSYSETIIERTRFRYDDDTGLEVLNRTDIYYQALDGTMMVEYMHHLIETTRAMIRWEVAFIAAYDDVVDCLGLKDDSRGRSAARVFMIKSFSSLADRKEAFSSNTRKFMVNKFDWTLEDLSLAADIATKPWSTFKAPVDVSSLGFPTMKFLDSRLILGGAQPDPDVEELDLDFGDEELPLVKEL